MLVALAVAFVGAAEGACLEPVFRVHVVSSVNSPAENNNT